MEKVAPHKLQMLGANTDRVLATGKRSQYLMHPGLVEEERDSRRTRRRAVDEEERAPGEQGDSHRTKIPGELGDEQSTTRKKSQAREARGPEHQKLRSDAMKITQVGGAWLTLDPSRSLPPQFQDRPARQNATYSMPNQVLSQRPATRNYPKI